MNRPAALPCFRRTFSPTCIPDSAPPYPLRTEQTLKRRGSTHRRLSVSVCRMAVHLTPILSPSYAHIGPDLENY